MAAIRTLKTCERVTRKGTREAIRSAEYHCCEPAPWNCQDVSSLRYALNFMNNNGLITVL